MSPLGIHLFCARRELSRFHKASGRRCRVHQGRIAAGGAGSDVSEADWRHPSATGDRRATRRRQAETADEAQPSSLRCQPKQQIRCFGPAASRDAVASLALEVASDAGARQ